MLIKLATFYLTSFLFIYSSCNNTKNIEFQEYRENKKFEVRGSESIPVMSDPSPNSNFISWINKNVNINIINIINISRDKYKLDNFENYWYYVDFDNRKGYIFGEYLQEKKIQYDYRQNCKLDFPNNFKSGILNLGSNCESIYLDKNGNFNYHFTGDCKGWGRILKGKWIKENNYIRLSAILTEGNKKDEIELCSGSHYSEYTNSEKNECIAKYRQSILSNFGKYPTEFYVDGYLKIDETIMIEVDLKSKLANDKNTKGLLNISKEKFTAFLECETIN
ncbi:hypothetical protein ND856_19205 [Leptospira bandrabouensis]|uniref:hypothetical protein n=1 Tax=Leptospira bandrabouensis TaxID=2484903 RepID=UPI00223D4233|nr:hypothetical protein [Leptospira bandrabouensis]MCW7460405.1 hypothetical protein [Leptospira bandrabouensis]MCW7479437.1 hypothetical protein [Leptospira bandrabouensis]MCW7487115.1 hypothetical protein [Leptospira bandrabouensis]